MRKREMMLDPFKRHIINSKRKILQKFNRLVEAKKNEKVKDKKRKSKARENLGK